MRSLLTVIIGTLIANLIFVLVGEAIERATRPLEQHLPPIELGRVVAIIGGLPPAGRPGARHGGPSLN